MLILLLHIYAYVSKSEKIDMKVIKEACFPIKTSL